MMLLALMTLSAAAAATADKEGPRISFTETAHDFGTINENDGAVTYKFYFTNDGDAPLVIVSAKASCGCTRPKYPLRPVDPGKSSFIKVTFLPEGRPGEFIKDVKVKTNDSEAKNVKLKISGTVIPATR